jgi:hypothetical protein
MLRSLPFVLIFVSASCAKPVALPGLSQDAKQASALIEELENDRGTRLGIRGDVRSLIVAKNLNEKQLLRGALEMLQFAEPKERKKGIWFLGRLGDPSAIGPLVKALDQSDEDSREDICFALQWLDAKGEPAESALVKLRREDQSADVRVAAAVALERPTDPEAVAAYELGLRLTKKEWVRELCEDELEKQGKLQLPLSEEIYTEIDIKKYEDLKGYMRITLRREITKGDTLFFEATLRRPDGLSALHDWYKVKVTADQIKKPPSELE